MSAIEARDRYVNAVKRDLFGPALGDREELPLQAGATPQDVYLTGILSCNLDVVEAVDDETAEVGSSTEVTNDDPISMNSIKRPTSCGVSFAVSAETTELDVQVRGGKYRRATGETWIRTPISIEKRVRLLPGLESYPLSDDLCLFVRCKASRQGGNHVTVVLNNEHRPVEFDKEQIAEGTLFQTELDVAPVDGGLVPRKVRRASRDEDARINDLLYRNKHEWAVGHICSAEWDDDQQPGAISASWFPSSIVPDVSSRGHALFATVATEVGVKEPFFATKLAEAQPAELAKLLSVLPEAYGRWLDEQAGKIPGLELEQEMAELNLSRARAIAADIRTAIEIIATDALVRRAFQESQRAMAMQFRWANGADVLSWRPFQLAFQLLAIPGMVLEGGRVMNPEARAQMDLLWFPTGGGKTEAYLALTAFAIFYRRLSAETPNAGAGVTVFMRYTLRLLTIQQFERASRLIVACDLIRRQDEGEFGTVPIGIGLWVGGDATPNRLKDLGQPEMLKKAKQLVKCPVCGALDPWNPIRNDLEVRCKAVGCEFGGERQPIYTVDDLVYQHRPSLVIGTIDKFAQIVRNSKTTRLFGKPELPPPDLIIQDELHLISGPLGTIAGVYEAAIDIICSRHGVPPKVVGSTATIRRAGDQVRALFDRDVRQFPPPVIDAADSCFAVERPTSESPGRLYIGVSTIGRSAKYSLQSVCAALQQNADPNAGILTKAEVDPYWTLVGYFNSLRELGGAVVMMYDDVPASIQSIADINGTQPRERCEVAELSSRMSSEEIPKRLDELTRAYPEQTYGVVVATNMISVGVDIPRLGLMVVNGQPKSMAEYIQATSRVGRGSIAGVVLTLYNAARPRDRSHFESFKTWHQALYAGVEPNSVTPWADRARSRTLHAAVVALARHCLGMAENDDAPRIVDHLDELRDMLGQLKERASHVDPDEASAVLKEATEFLDAWARQLPAKFWWDQQPKESLLISSEVAAQHGAAGGAWGGFARATPNSMRNIEPTTHVRMRNFLKLFGGTDGQQ